MCRLTQGLKSLFLALLLAAIVEAFSVVKGESHHLVSFRDGGHGAGLLDLAVREAGQLPHAAAGRPLPEAEDDIPQWDFVRVGVSWVLGVIWVSLVVQDW